MGLGKNAKRDHVLKLAGTIAPSSVSSISVTCGTGNDAVDLSGVKSANGFTHSAFSGLSVHITVTGGTGNDSILGSDFCDSLIGGDGNDTLDGGLKDDYFEGGNGNDTVTYANRSDDATFSSDDDGSTIEVDTGSGGLESDRVWGEMETFIGGSGNDGMGFGFYGQAVTLIGGPGNDTLYGTEYADSLDGGSGNDSIFGGADYYTGADGNDTLVGGSGNDTLDGNKGNDVLYGGDGNDSILVSYGNDTLSGAGASGTDSITLAGTVSATLTALTAQTFSSVSIGAGDKMTLDTGAGGFVSGSLTLNSTGRLDIKDNYFAVDYTGTSPFTTLRGQINTGYDAGAWDGYGIVSSTAASSPGGHGVGYANNSDLGLTSISGQGVDSTTVVMRYTWLGDTDLDGNVDDTDFANVRTAIAASAALDPIDRDAYATWQHGNFNYDSGQDTNGFEKGLSADDVSLMTASFNGIQNGAFDDLALTLPSITVDVSSYLSADASAYVQGALDDLEAQGGGTLIVDGTFNLGSTGVSLDGYSNIRLMADPVSGGGFYVTGVTTAPASGISADHDESMVMIAGASNIMIEGIEFDGNGVGVNGLGIFNSDHIIVDDDEFHNVDHRLISGSIYAAGFGIWGVANEHDHFTNNCFHDLPEGGSIYLGNYYTSSTSLLHGDQSETDAVVANNVIRSSNGDGLVGHICDMLISGNDIDLSDSYGDPAGKSGISLSGTGLAHGGLTHAVYSHDCVVVGNTVQKVLWHAIQSDVIDNTTADTITVMNNFFSSTGNSGVYGIKISNWNITGNVIESAGTGGQGITIEDGGSGTTISWNQVTNCTLQGIDVVIDTSGVSGLHIQHNICRNNGNYDLIFRNFDSSYSGTDFLITDNTLGSLSDSPCANYNLLIGNNGGSMYLYAANIYSNTCATSSIFGVLP